MKYLLHTLSCLLLFAAETCLAQTPGHTLRSGGIDRTSVSYTHLDVYKRQTSR